MGKYDRRSRDQKRKAKLKKELQKSRKKESLAYTGNKYKKEEYAPLVFRTEVGIHESYVMTERTLTDRDVVAALEQLIGLLRQGPLPALPADEPADADGDADLVVVNIRRNWAYLSAESHPTYTRDDVVGVLRTLLGSIDVWTTGAADSQGYLRYIEGFMKKAGVNVQRVDSDLVPIDEPDEDPLLELGLDWHDGDEAAGAEFRRQLDGLLRAGEAERVVGVCQELMGEVDDPDFLLHLAPYMLRGHDRA